MDKSNRIHRWLEVEVNNGGFLQYFWKPSGGHANQALSGLEKVGAIKNAALLESAMNIAYEGVAPVDRDARQALLE